MIILDKLSPYIGNSFITWYAVLMLAGAIVAYLFCEYFYRRNPESKKYPDLIFNTFLVAFPAGLIGGRIWYTLSDLDRFVSDPMSIFRVWEGGMAIQGGVILGAAAGIWFAIHMMRKKGMRLSIFALMDMVIPNILIAQVIGRWGNFMNQEVYGACVDAEQLKFIPGFILNQMKGGGQQFTRYDNNGNLIGSFGSIACPADQYAQPLFLYEGILNLAGFLIISFLLRKVWKKYRPEGVLAGLYFVWYGVVRAILEGFRNERFIMRWGNLSQSVITSIVFILVGVGFITYLYLKTYLPARKKKAAEGPVIENEIKEETIEQVEISDAKEEAVEVKVETKNEAKQSKKSATTKTASKSNTSKSKTTTGKRPSSNKTKTTNTDSKKKTARSNKEKTS